jgi:hypothetical protein
MPDYYNRQFELFISDRDVPFIAATSERQFKITFSILLDFGGFNTYADIAVYNLSRDTEGQVFKKGEYVGFRAGYVDTIDYIFKGEIVNIIREKQGGDTVTRLICKGGALSQEKSTINKSFESGVTVPELCRACAEALGFPIIINEDDFPGSSPYLSGYHLTGDPKVKLNQLAKSHDFQWLIESEKIIIVGKASFRKGSVVTVSASTGMVGVPEITEIGADVTVRINPTLRIGGRFEIKSEFAQVNYSNVYFQDVPETLGQGIYIIQKLQFDGDSYGDVWDTKISGLRAVA